MGQTGRDDQTERLKRWLNAPVLKRSVRISGHPTSVSLEKPFWDLLQNIAQKREISLNSLASEIDDLRSTNLSSAMRLYALAWVSGSNLQEPRE